MYKIYYKEPAYKHELLQLIYSMAEYMAYADIHNRHVISKYCRGCKHKSERQYCRKGIDQTNNKKHCKFKRSKHGK